MQIVVDILGIISLIITSLSMFFKKKAYIMLFAFFYNILILVSYLLLGRYLGCILVGVAILRALTFFLFALKNIKPNIYVYIVFNILAISLSIIFWNVWYDIFMLIALIISTYANWQENVKVLKIGALICMVFYILYNVFAGAYSYIASEVIYGLSALISLILTYKEEKKTKIEINDTIDSQNDTSLQ